MKSITVNINPKIILYILLTLIIIFLVVKAFQVVLILFLAFIINAALRPLVDKLEARRVPRVISILLIYIVVFFILGLILVVIANEFLHQATNLITAFPDIYARVVEFARTNLPALSNVLPLDSLQEGINSLAKQYTSSNELRNLISGGTITDVASQALSVLGGVSSFLVSFFTMIIVSIYMLQRKRNVYHGLLDLLPKKQQDRLGKLLAEVESSLGGWLVGQFILMLSVGVITYLIVMIPGLFDPSYRLDDYAITLGLMAGLLEGLPNLGPVITMIILSIVALGTSGVGVLVYIIIASILLQNLEAVFLVPKIMERAVGLDPIITILSVIGAFEIGGMLAALLVIPVVAVIQITIKEITSK
jgi:predicted PurR-regulated permease PerM